MRKRLIYFGQMHLRVVLKVLVKKGASGIHFLQRGIPTKQVTSISGHLWEKYFEQLPFGWLSKPQILGAVV